MSSFGFKNPQIKIAGSIDNGILFETDIYSNNKTAKVEVPIKFKNGKSLYPNVIFHNGKKLAFKKNLF